MRTLLDAIFGDYWFDPSIIDLVLWFPHLSWRDFIVSAIAVLTWNWLCDGLWRLTTRWAKTQVFSVLSRGHKTRKNSNATHWRPPPWPANQAHTDWSNLASIKSA